VSICARYLQAIALLVPDASLNNLLGAFLSIAVITEPVSVWLPHNLFLSFERLGNPVRQLARPSSRNNRKAPTSISGSCSLNTAFSANKFVREAIWKSMPQFSRFLEMIPPVATLRVVTATV